MAKSTIYLRQKLAETLLTGTAFSVSNLYVGIFEVLPTLDDASDGTEFTPGIGGYARVEAKNKWTQDAGSLPTLVRYENNQLLAFESLATGWKNNNSTCDIQGVGFWDASTGGNCLVFATITPQRVIHPNQDMDINIGGLTIDFSAV